MAGERTLRVRIVGSAKEAEKSFGKVAAGLAGLVTAAAATAASLAGALDLEAGTDRLAAQLGLTAKQSEEAGDIAGSLYANAYGDSMQAVNDSVGAVLASSKQLGLQGKKDIEAVSATAMDLENVFGIGVAESVNTVGILIKNGLAKDATEGFDLMTASFQKVPAAMREELPDIINEYGVNFAALGFSGEEAMGMLVSASSNGAIGLDKFGDSLKELTISGTDMSATSVEAYETLGLNAQEMSNALLAGGDTSAAATQKIAESLLGIKDPAKQANTAIALFGAPLEDIGTNNVPDFLNALVAGETGMEGFADASGKMSETLNDNLKTKLTGIWRTLKTEAVDAIGGALMPHLNTLADFATKNIGPAMDHLAHVLEMVSIAFQTIGEGDSDGFAEVLDNIFGNTGKLIPVLRNMGDAIITVVDFVRANAQPVLAGLAAAVAAVLIPAFVSWAVAAGAAAVATIAAAAPIILVVAAIGLLVAGLVYAWKNFDWFRNGITKAASVIKSVVVTSFEAIRGVITHVVGAIREYVGPVVQEIAGWFRTQLGSVVAWVQQYWPQISQAFQNVMTFVSTVVQVYMAIVVTVIKTVMSVIGTVIRVGLELVSAIWDRIGGNIVNIVRNVFGLIAGIIRGVVTVIGGIIRMVSALFTGDWKGVWEGFKQVIRGAVTIVTTIVKSLAGIFSNAISAAVKIVKTVGGKILDSLVAAVKWGAGKVGEWLASIYNNLRVKVLAMVTGVTSWSRNILSGLWNAVKAGAGNVNSWITSVRDNIRNKVVGMVQSMGSWSNGIFNGLVGRIKTGYENVKAWMDSLRERIRSTISGLGSTVTSASRGIFNGLSGAFSAAINGVIAKWNNLSFSVPSVTIAGQKFGGGTISTPNVPMLATGGDILRKGFAIVGEAGPELVEMNPGARVTPLPGSAGYKGGDNNITVNAQTNADPQEIGREIAWQLKIGAI